MDTNRIESLDSLRGIASLIVVIFHSLISFILFYNANYDNVFETDSLALFTLSPLRVLWAGNEAVLLFFVLSGFVLSIPVFKGKNQIYTAYLTKRFFRIYFPYIIVVTVSVVLATLFRGYNNVEGLSSIYYGRWDNDPSLESILGYIFMIPIDTNANGVVWTLFHEMRISIVLPIFLFIIYKFKFIKSFVLTMSISVFAFVFFYVLNVIVHNDTLSIIFDDFSMSAYYSIFFVFGAFLSRYREQISFISRKQWWIKLGLFILSLLLINNRWMLLPLNLDITMIENAISAIGILIIFALVLNSTFANKLLTSKPLLWLGKVSFSLYLVHIPVIMLTTIFLGKIVPIEMAFLVAIILSLPVAGLTYMLVEVPAIKIGKTMSNKITKKKLVDESNENGQKHLDEEPEVVLVSKPEGNTN